jgi:glycosyltransferase involved in cell wall biosynthesis
MNVLYDAANLGLSFGSGLTRTGIFRATESFVREVLARPDIESWFAAPLSYASEVQLARYDRSVDGLLGSRWLAGWEAPGTTLTESMGLVDRLMDVGEETSRGKRFMADLMLLDRMAQAQPLVRNFDVYHSFRNPLAGRTRVAAEARVVTIHDMIPLLFPELCEERFVKQHRSVIGSIDPDRDWIICNSECTKDDVCELVPVERGRVFVTPFAASRDIFHPEPEADRIAAVRRRYGVESMDYVLSLCTLEPRKNLPHLVRSFFSLVEQEGLEGVSLVLVGPTGWKSQALFSTLETRADLRDRVVLTGYVPDEDLSALYSGARLFAYPSLYEGFGLPVLEAMQCGLPVITSNASSLPEVVGSAALTVDPTDQDALSGAILEVLSDPELKVDLSHRGLDRAREFSWARTVEETIQAYRKMIGE